MPSPTPSPAAADGRPDLAIVTAATASYVWGAWLLVASLRRNGIAARVHVLEKGFGERERRLIEQFADARVIPLASGDQRSLTVRKPEALLSADAEWIAWIDSDCMIIGDLGPLLVPAHPALKVRVRGSRENAQVWRGRYAAGDATGGIPGAVAERWRADVADRDQPRLTSTVCANALVFHRSHRPFIELWDRQMRAVLPADVPGVCLPSEDAYRMTDESVLSSLLAYSSLAPTLAGYDLGNRHGHHLAHFGVNPKPWTRWRWRTWYCYRHVQDLLRWAGANGYEPPERPWSFRRRWMPVSFAAAAAEGVAGLGRRAASRSWRAIVTRRPPTSRAAEPLRRTG